MKEYTPKELKEFFNKAYDAGDLELAKELYNILNPLETEQTPEKASFLEEAKLAFDLSRTDIENWAIAIQAAFPQASAGYSIPGVTGDFDSTDFRLFIPARERFGDEYMDEMSYEERLEFLRNHHETRAIQKNIETVLSQKEYGKNQTASAIGDAVGNLSSPTSLVPFSQKAKVAAATGAFIAAEMDTAEQLVENRFDPVEKVKNIALGTVAPAIGEKVIKAVQASPKAVENATKFIANKLDRRTEAAKSQANANTVVNKIEKEYALGVAAGKDEKTIRAETNKKLGLTETDVLEAVSDSGRDLIMPNVTAANQILASKNNPVGANGTLQKTFDYLAAPISTRIGNIDSKLMIALRDMDRQVNENIGNELNLLENFFTVTSKEVSPLKRGFKQTEEFETFQNHLFNGRYKQAQEIADKNYPELSTSLETVQRILNKKYDELKEVGVEVGYLQDYFPRVIKDREGLLDSLGTTKKSLINKALDDVAVKHGATSLNGKADISKLDDSVINETINKVLNGYIPTKTGLSFTKTRTIEELPAGLQQYYYSAPESLMLYLQNANREIAKRKFFGKNTSVDEVNQFDLGTSIGKLTGDLIKKGTLTDEAADDLARLLQARFNGEKLVMQSGVAKLRDIQYMSLLAQPDSALVQLGDIGVSAYLNGIRNTVGSMLGKRQLDSEDLGIMNKVSDKIAAELANTNGYNKALNNFFQWSGFRAVDKLGKDTLIDASLKKYQKLAQKNPAGFRKKWEGTFGDEVENVLGDLQQKEITDNVKLLVWNDLADAQPITLSEMPEAYLNNPNGRIFYALKTFTLKQMDLMRKQVIQEYKNGNKEQALTNAFKYAAIVGGANASVQTLRDHLKALELPEVPDDVEEAAVGTMDAVVESLLGQFFLNKYSRERYLSSGDWPGFLQNMLTPPGLKIGSDIAGDIGMGALEAYEGELDPMERSEEIVKNMPIVGKVLNNLLYGGMEKAKDKLEEEGLIESLVNR